MKKITNKTILKQGEKEFKPVDVDGVIFWQERTKFLNDIIVAQSSEKLKGVPVVSLDGYIERLADLETPLRIVKGSFIKGYKSNPNHFTLKDIERALGYGYHTAKDEAKGIPSSGYGTRFIELITSIQSITVNENWEVVSYE